MTTPGKVVSTHLYRIRFDWDGRHLRASVSGYTGSQETSMAYWRAIADEAHVNAASAVLVVDQREGQRLPEDQMAEVLDALHALGMANVRLALVETQLEHFAQAEATEILAREKDFDIRAFSNEMEAAVWLRHGEP